VIVAGFGCRAGCSPADLLAAFELALAGAGRASHEVYALSAPDSKRAEPGLQAVAAQLGKTLVVLSAAALQRHAGRTLTSSQHALRHYGVGSVAEAAALAGAALHAGTAHLLGPRCIAGAATCALASPGPDRVPA
jgi:cobalt-precorrin 5A hydrolase